MREHGTRAKYVAEKCHCADCRRANTAYQTAREKRIAYERFGAIAPALVPAGQAKRHLRSLRRHGVGLRQICRLTGLSRSSLQKLRDGRRRRVTFRTHDLVTGICMDERAAGRWGT
jgi:hypothetical protein